MTTVKIKKLTRNEDILLPKYQTDGSCAFDLHAAVKEKTIIKPGEVKLIPTGFMMEFEKGLVAEITPRSGLALKFGISIVNSPALVDSDYRGEVGIILINLGREDFIINRNDRVAQMSIRRYEHAKIEEVEVVSETQRGTGGYGSTEK